jgi:hypothetical protein
MIGRRAILGLCMLCALAFSAIAAQGASAVTGTTAFTCKKVTPAVETAGFKDEHCKEAVSSNANFEHVAFAQETTTKFTSSNITTGTERSITRLKSVQAGIEFEISANIAAGSGWLTNALNEKEHYVHGEGTVTFSEVRVTKPANKGCEVFTDNGGVEEGVETVMTKQLKGTTKGQGDRVKIEPAVGTTLATFFVTNCTVPALNGTYEVTGSLTGTTNGATLIFTHADVTAQGTLKLRGQKAGLDGSFTFKGKDETAGDPEYTPLTVTTVET